MSEVMDFEYFKELARRELEPDAKSGFGPEHRADKTDAIKADLVSKLPALRSPGSRFIDIGCGCSSLTRALLSHCAEIEVETVLVDSAEVLEQLGGLSAEFIPRPHRFPDSAEFLAEQSGAADSVLIYSVLQVSGEDQDPLELILAAAGLLKPGGGRLLVGDIPNSSKKRRFLASEFGQNFDRAWRSVAPEPSPSALQHPLRWSHEFDDASILKMLHGIRAAGYESYVVPQPDGLSMNWTREDLLVVRV